VTEPPTDTPADLRADLRARPIGMFDSGIGGRSAEPVGRSLWELARSHQVLCVTHLGQIAAYADAQFRIEKHQRDGRTVTEVHRLGEAVEPAVHNVIGTADGELRAKDGYNQTRHPIGWAGPVAGHLRERSARSGDED